MPKTQTPEEIHAYKMKVIAATAEGILHDLDGLLMGAYNIYDIGNAIPHPYDAIGSLGQKYLHDFKAASYSIKKYIELVQAELKEES